MKMKLDKAQVVEKMQQTANEVKGQIPADLAGPSGKTYHQAIDEILAGEVNEANKNWFASLETVLARFENTVKPMVKKAARRAAKLERQQ
jgi:hypothetical protein